MLAYLFVLLAFAVRLAIPYLHAYPFHFTPVAASLLFFGAYGSRRQLWIPVGLLAVSDVILSKFVYHYPVDASQIVSWAWYAAIILLGTRLRNHEKPLWIGLAALASPISFFLISNFAAWAAFPMYPKTFAGLMSSYSLGVPFFRNDLIGTMLFTAVFFAIPALLRLPESRKHGAAA
jgi:uncharacterized protein DUF6580